MGNPLFWNFILYLFYFLYIYRKEERLTVYSIIFLYQTFISFMGLYTFETGIYQKTFGRHTEAELSLAPYLLNFVCFLIISHPLKDFEAGQLQPNKEQEKVYSLISTFVCVITVVYSIVLYLYSNLIGGLSYADQYNMARVGEMTTFGNPILDFILNRFYQILLLLIPFAFAYNFIRLSRRKNVKKSTIIILLIFLPQFLSCVVMAARGRMFFLFTQIVFFIVLFYPLFNIKFKRNIKRFGMIFIVIACFYSYLISSSRFENSNQSTIHGIARYFGEPYPNLSISYWNASEINHPYGLRQFYGICKYFNDDLRIDKGLGIRQDYWSYRTKVPIQNFKTLYGDLYVEFGHFIPFLVLGLTACIYVYLRRRVHGVMKVVAMYFCYKICVMGLFDNVAEFGVIEIILVFLVSFAIDKFGQRHIQKAIR